MIEKEANLSHKTKEGNTPLQTALVYLSTASGIPPDLLDLLVLKTPDGAAQVEQYRAQYSTSNLFLDEWLFLKRHTKLEELSDGEFLNYLYAAFRFNDLSLLKDNVFKRPGILEMAPFEGRTLLFQIFQELEKKNSVISEIQILIQELLAMGGQQQQKEIAFNLAQKGSDHLLQILLPYAGSLAPDEKGKTPFHYLASKQKNLAPFAPYVPDTYQGSQLQQAILSRDLTRIHELCQAGEHLKSIDGKGRSALHHACISGDAEIFQAVYPYTKKPICPPITKIGHPFMKLSYVIVGRSSHNLIHKN